MVTYSYMNPPTWNFQVELIQVRLFILGFAGAKGIPWIFSGRFDINTVKAVANFQYTIGIDVTGKADSDTQTAILQAMQTIWTKKWNTMTTPKVYPNVIQLVGQITGTGVPVSIPGGETATPLPIPKIPGVY